jgi:chloramphenicol 3-O-phosphotransferase
MSSSTFATVIIQAADQAAAQADFPGLFTAAYADFADRTVTTHYVSSGFFFDEELDKIVNDVTWPRVVRFGDAQAALASMGLVPVQTPVEESAE